jgi:hypothetical protein
MLDDITGRPASSQEGGVESTREVKLLLLLFGETFLILEKSGAPVVKELIVGGELISEGTWPYL